MAVRPHRARPTILLPFLLVVVTLAAACAPVKGGAPGGVVLWGDSFGEQIAPHVPYESHVFGGSAPCDWLPQMRELAATRPPGVAVLLFAGSTNTPCTGHNLATYPGQVHEATQVLGGAGWHVIVLAAPCVKQGPEVNPVYTAGGVPLEWRPYAAVCPNNQYVEQYRQGDQHLNATGIALFTQALRGVAG